MAEFHIVRTLHISSLVSLKSPQHCHLSTILLYFDSNTIPVRIHSNWTGAFPWCDAVTEHDFPKAVVCAGVMCPCLCSNIPELSPFKHVRRRSSDEVMAQKTVIQIKMIWYGLELSVRVSCSRDSGHKIQHAKQNNSCNVNSWCEQ